MSSDTVDRTERLIDQLRELQEELCDALRKEAPNSLRREIALMESREQDLRDAIAEAQQDLRTAYEERDHAYELMRFMARMLRDEQFATARTVAMAIEADNHLRRFGSGDHELRVKTIAYLEDALTKLRITPKSQP